MASRTESTSPPGSRCFQNGLGAKGQASLLLGAPLSSLPCSVPSYHTRVSRCFREWDQYINLIMANSHFELSKSHDLKYPVLLFP